MRSISLVLALLLISSLPTFASPSLPLDAKNESIFLHHHSKLRALIQSSLKRAHLSTLDQEQVGNIVKEIETLGTELFDHEHKLNALKFARRTEKARFGVFWWMNAVDRIKVREMDLKVKDQQRIVENTKEDIDLHWIRLKPFFGVYSEVIHFP